MEKSAMRLPFTPEGRAFFMPEISHLFLFFGGNIHD
jgi:hypothetical protein